MNESPEMIRKQMQQTKLQLAEKLESLEQQVSATVHTTETAVNATVEAVQTVEGAVHNAVDSVVNVLDVSRHVENHPWLVVGGAVVVGYLAAEFLTGPPTANGASQESSSPSSTNQPDQSNTPSVATALTGTASVTHGHPSVSTSSPWQQLRDATIGSLIGIVPEIISRIIPRVVDQLVDNWSQPPKVSSPKNADGETAAEHQPPPIESHRLRIAHSGTSRSKLFD